MFGESRRTTPSRSGDTTCQVFQWIGQRYDTCDDCGRPERTHLYRPTLGRERPDLRVKVYRERDQVWLWEPVMVLPPGGEVFRDGGRHS
jgi:hypothetical protein